MDKPPLPINIQPKPTVGKVLAKPLVEAKELNKNATAHVVADNLAKPQPGQNKKSQFNTVLILSVIGVGIIIVNLLLLIFIKGEAKTTKLIKEELVTLEQDEQIIDSAQDIRQRFKDQIDIISQVFPDEQSLPSFIQILENKLTNSGDSYQLKFNSVTPLEEADNTYLPLTIVMQTDIFRLLDFLEFVETIPFMTHVTKLDFQTSEDFTNLGKVTIGLKVYVKKPFFNK